MHDNDLFVDRGYKSDATFSVPPAAMMASATLLASNGGKRLIGNNKTAEASTTAASASADSSAFSSLDHDKRRKITLKCLELEEMLESQG